MNKFKKTLTLFLASVLAFTGVLFSSSNASAVKYTYYSNRGTGYYYTQAGWWNLGGDVRSGKNGCGITSFAIAVSILRGRRITPRAVASVVAKRGYWNLRGNTPVGLTKKLASAAGLKFSSIGKNVKRMVTALYKGGILVIRAHGTKPFSNGGHYIAVVGARSDGYFKIVDPGDRSYRPKWIHYKTFLNSMKSSYSVFALSK